MTPVTRPTCESDPAPENPCVAEKARPRGRPREADRTPAILAATIELLDDVGYDQMRVQDVADRAGVGLATIYRRWPTKQALVIEALRAKPLDLPDTGNVRADLASMYQRVAEGMNGGGQLVSGCLAVARDEPEILQALRDSSLCEVRRHMRRLIATEVGDDDPDLDLRVDMGPGLLLLRGMMFGEPVTAPEVLDRLVDAVLRPRLAQ
ncbi:MAG: putative TetR-family transcriptional regulator [Acidimicrobiia bacterium]|nr:putative TetR-family transcriptional regulator [Acidimicrobiia bacterium]